MAVTMLAAASAAAGGLWLAQGADGQTPSTALECQSPYITDGEPLHSRVGKYVKMLEAERTLRPITRQIMKNCIGIFQSYNDVRNNASFAHDNALIDAQEARFIFDTVIAMLRFVRAVESSRFEPTA